MRVIKEGMDYLDSVISAHDEKVGMSLWRNIDAQTDQFLDNL